MEFMDTSTSVGCVLRPALLIHDQLPAISDSTLPFDANTEYVCPVFSLLVAPQQYAHSSQDISVHMTLTMLQILSSLMDQPPSSPPDDLSVFSEASPSISDPISDPEDIFNNIVVRSHWSLNGYPHLFSEWRRVPSIRARSENTFP